MNENQPTQLIDPDELRLALKPMRPDRDQFVAGVERRLASHTTESHLAKTAIESDDSRSRWLQTAAAVIPLPLFGKASGLGLVKFSQLSLSQKAIVIVALPATTILLMLAATLWAVIKIRRAQRGQTEERLDALKLSNVSLAWWRQYAVITFALSGLIVLLSLTGHAFPVLAFFAVSGIALVSLVTTLGRHQLVDRKTLAGFLAPSMFNVMQLSLGFSFFDRGLPFLDQALIASVLAFGVAFISLVFPPLGKHNRMSNIVQGISAGMLGAWFACSYLNPVTQQEMVRYVESFDHARFSSASWERWEAPARWLIDSKIKVDMSKPRALLERELSHDEPNVHVLLSAMKAGLLEPKDLDAVRQLEQWTLLLLSRDSAGQSIVSVDGLNELVIRASVLRGELTEAGRDYLSGRLLATLAARKAKHNGRLLEDLLKIDELSSLINRPLNRAAHRDFVHQALVDHQVLAGRSAGGFRSYADLYSSADTTLAGIELMERYGLPQEVHVNAVRSFLRPRFEEQGGGIRQGAYVREVSLRRLNALPGVEPISLWDFLHHEQNLLMSILFTLVCIFAIWGAPSLNEGQAVLFNPRRSQGRTR